VKFSLCTFHTHTHLGIWERQ